MYSQDAIHSRRSGRSGPTEETLAGLACAICGTDYRSAPATDARVVSRLADQRTLACQGVCARLACGSATGLDETPLPLAERVSRYEAGQAQQQSSQGQGNDA